MEGNLLGLHSSFQHIDFVPTEDDWDVLTNSNDVTVPIWNILVRGPGSDIKHDDGTIALDIISVTQSSELFLSSSVPNIEADDAAVCMERKGVNFHPDGGDVLLLEFSCQVPFDEGRLSCSSIPNQDKFEGCNRLCHHRTV
jgi:hypothetical protein